MLKSAVSFFFIAVAIAAAASSKAEYGYFVLGGIYFGKGHNKPIDYILNYAFYYGAQFLIAWSVLFA